MRNVLSQKIPPESTKTMTATKRKRIINMQKSNNKRAVRQEREIYIRRMLIYSPRTRYEIRDRQVGGSKRRYPSLFSRLRVPLSSRPCSFSSSARSSEFVIPLALAYMNLHVAQLAWRNGNSNLFPSPYARDVSLARSEWECTPLTA